MKGAASLLRAKAQSLRTEANSLQDRVDEAVQQFEADRREIARLTDLAAEYSVAASTLDTEGAA